MAKNELRRRLIALFDESGTAHTTGRSSRRMVTTRNGRSGMPISALEAGVFLLLEMTKSELVHWLMTGEEKRLQEDPDA